MSSDSVSNLMKGHMESLAAEGKRADGRSINEFRNVSIETGMINTAEGSALVHLGKTKILCGIKLLIGTPYGDSPGSGTMTTTAELAPLADQSFDPGPPREQSIELSRVVDRGIRESRMIDFEALCIEEGEKVWMVFIDLHILEISINRLSDFLINHLLKKRSWHPYPVIDNSGRHNMSTFFLIESLILFFIFLKFLSQLRGVWFRLELAKLIFISLAKF